MPRTALLVIDIQVGIAQDPATEIRCAQRVRDAGTEVLARGRAAIAEARMQNQQADLEIVVVQHEETPESGTLLRGSKAWEVVFKPRGGDHGERLVSKNVRNTFESNPKLASQLKAEGIDTIVAFGIQSECCVRSTCLGALAAGFKVVLLQGAHSTYDSDDQQAEEIEKHVEEELKANGATVVPWETWMP